MIVKSFSFAAKHKRHMLELKYRACCNNKTKFILCRLATNDFRSLRTTRSTTARQHPCWPWSLWLAESEQASWPNFSIWLATRFNSNSRLTAFSLWRYSWSSDDAQFRSNSHECSGLDRPAKCVWFWRQLDSQQTSNQCRLWCIDSSTG